MIATANTLNGMTVEQLRDLAARAEATAKQKEAKSTYVELGRGVDGLRGIADLKYIQFLITRYIDLKERGLIK